VPSTGDAPEDAPPAAAGDKVNRVVLGFALAPADPEAAGHGRRSRCRSIDAFALAAGFAFGSAGLRVSPAPVDVAAPKGTGTVVRRGNGVSATEPDPRDEALAFGGVLGCAGLR